MDKEMYDMLTEIRDITIETKTKVSDLCNHDTDHEERIRKLEDKPARRWDSLVMGFLGAAIVWIFSLFTKK